MYQHALKAGNGNKVIITETGWPNHGTAFKDSTPSLLNANRYYVYTKIGVKKMI